MSTAVKDSSYFIPAPSKWPAVGSVSMILRFWGCRVCECCAKFPLCSHCWVTCFGLHVFWLVWSSCKSRKRVSTEQR